MRHSLLAYATVAAGLGVTVAGALAAVGRPLTALALLGAAALAAELLEEPDASRIREPVGPGVFRVASGVDLAEATERDDSGASGHRRSVERDAG